MRGIVRVTGVLSMLLVSSLFWSSQVNADRFTSPSYTIDASTVGGSIAGPQSSSSYALTSSGGESVIGNGAGGSYMLTQGYVSQLEQGIQISISPSTINLSTVIPGTPNTTTVTATVQTDAPGYLLGVSQNNDLTTTGATIPGVSGSIGTPVTWANGTTKGLGFSLASTNATALPGKWNAGASYAAFPGTSTTFYTRTGYTAGATDSHTMNVKLDVNSDQKSGSYTNTVTWTGTMTP